LQYIFTEDLRDQEKASPVRCASDYYTVVDLVPLLHQGCILEHRTVGFWADFSGKQVLGSAEETIEAPTKKYLKLNISYLKNLQVNGRRFEFEK
jgi:hypothetical protein